LAGTGFLAVRTVPVDKDDWEEWLACSRACVNKIGEENDLEVTEE
jgi:hypothetical protein